MSGLRRVAVLWEDSTLLPIGSWMTRQDAVSRRGAVRVESIGYALADDKRGVVLAGTLHGDEVAGVVVIPRSQVRKVRRLR